jgi:hypothetical protein
MSYSYDQISDLLLETGGFDLTFDVEYPLSEQLDVGASVENIPIKAAVLTNKASFSTEYGLDVPSTVLSSVLADPSSFNYEDFLDLPEEDPALVYGTGEIEIIRPVKIGLVAGWHMFDSKAFRLTFIPNIKFGFEEVKAVVESENLDPYSFLFDFGVKADMRLLNDFLGFSFASNYIDKVWEQNLGMFINIRILEIDLAVSSESSDFVQSFLGSGIGVTAAVKLGF